MEQTERITRIIRQLLDFARPRPVEKARIDLRAVATQTIALLRPMADKQRIALGLVGSDEPAMAVVDPGQMQQVITNLIVNAIQASGNGGKVNLGFRREVTTPPLKHGGTKGSFVCLYVEDNGHGMDEETQARIFDPFFTTKDVGAGTGLGLSIAYGMVRDHGGWIDVKSKPGAGTTISIHLPVERKQVTK
jgi:signal transduction histidine kinase